MSGKHWNKAAQARLRVLWPIYPKADILKAFPSRSWKGITQEAFALKLRRKASTRTRSLTNDPLMDLLRKARVASGMSAAAVGRQIAMSRAYVASCERGQDTPSLPILMRWCAFLGLELTVRPFNQH